MSEYTAAVGEHIDGSDCALAHGFATRLHPLNVRFSRALAAVGVRGSGSLLFSELVTRYAEPHRQYHTLEHVDACLSWLDWFAGSACHPEEVELALWFHDAVYSLGSSANEAASAALARERLTALGARRDAVERIAASVECTRTHSAAGGDAALVVDLDLTILGARQAAFDEFERRIRREYAHVPDDVFRAARLRILEGFVARPEIYGVSVVRAELERPARVNLSRRIAELR